MAPGHIRGAVFFLALGAFGAFSALAGLQRSHYSPIGASSGDVVPGVWNADFVAVTNYAARHRIPAVVVFVNPLGSCGACERFQTACNTAEFLAWQKDRKIAMAFTTQPKAQTFARPAEKIYRNGTPLICVWLPTGDGKEERHAFSGVLNKMPSRAGRTLATQAINSIELYLGDYSAQGEAESSRRLTLPLYGAADAKGRLLSGCVDIRFSADGSVAAKTRGCGLSPSSDGIWFRGTGLETGTRELVSGNGEKLTIVRDGAGRVSVSFDCGAKSFSSGEPVSEPKAGAYVGFYTVAFSDAAREPFSCCGWLQMSLAASGEAKWHGQTAFGASVSGRCRVSVDAKGRAIVPVFDVESGLAVALMVRRGAAAYAVEGDCRAVKVAEGTIGCISRAAGSDRRFTARGSYISRDVNLEDAADDAYASTVLNVIFDPAAPDVSAASPTGRVSVVASGLALVDKSGGDLSFSYFAGHGSFSGVAAVKRADGTTGTVAYRGVLIPGWHDCGCNEALLKPETPFHIEHARPFADPFAAGGAWEGTTPDGPPLSWTHSVRID